MDWRFDSDYYYYYYYMYISSYSSKGYIWISVAILLFWIYIWITVQLFLYLGYVWISVAILIFRISMDISSYSSKGYIWISVAILLFRIYMDISSYTSISFSHPGRNRRKTGEILPFSLFLFWTTMTCKDYVICYLLFFLFFSLFNRQYIFYPCNFVLYPTGYYFFKNLSV